MNTDIEDYLKRLEHLKRQAIHLKENEGYTNREIKEVLVVELEEVILQALRTELSSMNG